MNFKSVISRACGLQGVEIENYVFHDESMELVLGIRQRREEAKCCHCRSELTRVHEWVEREIKGPPIGAYKTLLRFSQLRAYCARCETNRMSEAKWIHPQFSNYSCCFAEVAGRLMEEITCEAVGRLLGADSSTLWRLDQYRMKLMLKKYELPKDIDLSHLSADEVHFKTVRIEKREGLWEKRWDIKYITNLVCYSEGKVLWNAPNRDATSLHDCLDILTRGQKDQVKYFAVDMHDPFIAALNDKLPKATVVIDRFHLAKKINEAFDSVRKAEFKKAREAKDEFGLSMLHPHRRFILVSREKRLSEPEKQSLKKLRKINQTIHDAMLIVEQFHVALDKTNVDAFRKTLRDWYKLVRESGLRPFKKAALSIRKHRKAIEAYITSGLTSSVSEGLNNKIKTLKRMGYGYTNQQSFRRKILQRCGYLNSAYINTNDFFFSVPDPGI